MNVIFDKEKQKVPIFSWCDNLEPGALEQALMAANHPAVYHHVALMPDCHQGFGVPVGCVWALDDAISPWAVGSDIGCGMVALNTGLTWTSVKEKIADIMKRIKFLMPVGMAHRDPKKTTTSSEKCVEKLHGKYDGKSFWKTAPVNIDQCVREQIATLGGGNHFWNLLTDEQGNTWIMIHSGSRNIGKTVCDTYSNISWERNQAWHTNLPVEMKALSFLPFSSNEGKEYFDAMNFCLDFAEMNRYCMMEISIEVFEALGFPMPPAKKMINIHHNYAALESHFKETCIVHRKGATFASHQTTGIIPGSMGTASYIVQGLGQPKSFHSCSHGAGRAMSRTQAKSSIGMEAFKKSMKGIEFTPTHATLDESPDAYKDIEKVMTSQSDLVKILYKLMPVAVIKGE